MFFLVDDLGWADRGWADRGCYGITSHKTPNIKRNDLADDRPDVRDSLRKKLSDWRVPMNAKMPVERGKGDVLSNVSELRFDLMYNPSEENNETWIDDFGWG